MISLKTRLYGVVSVPSTWAIVRKARFVLPRNVELDLNAGTLSCQDVQSLILLLQQGAVKTTGAKLVEFESSQKLALFVSHFPDKLPNGVRCETDLLEVLQILLEIGAK